MLLAGHKANPEIHHKRQVRVSLAGVRSLAGPFTGGFGLYVLHKRNL